VRGYGSHSGGLGERRESGQLGHAVLCRDRQPDLRGLGFVVGFGITFGGRVA
jgi:hypothetical protein